MKSRVYLWSDLSQLFLKWEMSQKIIVEKIKTIIWYSIFFFPKIVPFMRLGWKIC